MDRAVQAVEWNVELTLRSLSSQRLYYSLAWNKRTMRWPPIPNRACPMPLAPSDTRDNPVRNRSSKSRN